ncbi:MAG: methylmalonyl-CoA mutase family protein, partial [Deltaproteobacteria bacterium]|nr:methylmalonyl-CoA mutase family protein [Deltaproteobacteria bacterium]
KVVVGLNKYPLAETRQISYLKIDPEVERRQIARLQETKQKRNSRQVQTRLAELKEAAQGSENLMPYILGAVKEYATLQEICDVFREVFGGYHDPGFF